MCCNRTDHALAQLIEIGAISEYEYTESNEHHFLVVGISS